MIGASASFSEYDGSARRYTGSRSVYCEAVARCFSS